GSISLPAMESSLFRFRKEFTRRGEVLVCQEKIDNDILAGGSSSPSSTVGEAGCFLHRDTNSVPYRADLMPFDLPQHTSKMGGPLVRQFSVFLPNKVDRKS